MTNAVFLIALAIAGTTLVLVAGAIAGAIRGRKLSRPELDQLRDHVDHQAAEMEELQNGLAAQSTQLAELQERLDFAERLLAQSRDRAMLRPGDGEP